MNNDTNKLIMTAEGEKKLKKELEQLKTVQRKRIAIEIQKAIEFGDLSENAAYSMAVEKRDLNETRIAELEQMLEKVEVITVNMSKTQNGRVQIGSKVKVKFNDMEIEWLMVGACEGDPAKGKIASDTPIGRALMDKKAGERVVIDLPTGQATYDVISVK